MLNFIHKKWFRFRNSEDGSIIVEAVIMLPTLFAAVLATFVFFDAFRNQAINLKANYTIADSLTRQELYVTNTQIVNTWRLHRFLTNSSSMTRLRISVISYDEDDDQHRVVWSRAEGGGIAYTDSPISVIDLNPNQIPVMSNEEVLIVIQTEVDYEPGYNIGLGAFTFANTTYTRPRWNRSNLCFSYDGTDDGRICPGDS